MIKETIIKIITNKIGVKFTYDQLDTPFCDVKLDSIDLLQLLMRCEKQFCMNISDDDLDNVHTVNDLCDIIQRQKNEHH